jgi:hypothetical protein
VVGTVVHAARGEAAPEFAVALAAFEQGCWQDAGRGFATVLASDRATGQRASTSVLRSAT